MIENKESNSSRRDKSKAYIYILMFIAVVIVAAWALIDAGVIEHPLKQSNNPKEEHKVVEGGKTTENTVGENKKASYAAAKFADNDDRLDTVHPEDTEEQIHPEDIDTVPRVAKPLA